MMKHSDYRKKAHAEILDKYPHLFRDCESYDFHIIPTMSSRIIMGEIFSVSVVDGKVEYRDHGILPKAQIPPPTYKAIRGL